MRFDLKTRVIASIAVGLAWARIAHAEPAVATHKTLTLDGARERRQFGQIAFVERVGRRDRQRHAVQDHRIVAPHRLENAARVAARDHEVL